ncbi:hypothetical protein [Bacillus atrophaeus]|nr:hypothetical protein [Bacillus atrophaeus]MCY8827260.1 hypothetical protein [Bacillus atrophaeus]MEC0831243.1 hypothetical protein [Bacillus atrophaeus]MEC0904246.1 hypothetical protein [Bacillus atrophaeus]
MEKAIYRKLTEQEVKSAFKKYIDSIFSAFDKAGNKLRPDVMSYAT